MTMITITEEEFSEHCDSYDGVCVACGEWGCGGVEPDAMGYECECCGEMKVMGAENALIMGMIEFSEE
jgi:hypothetical protein